MACMSMGSQFVIISGNSGLKEGRPKFFYGHIIVIAGFFILLVMWGATFCYGVFFKPMADEFGWTRAMTSGAFSLYMVMHGVIYIVTGRLSDRFGPRAVMTVCGLFLGAGFLLMSQVNTIWQLYLFYGVLVGIGVGGGFVPLSATVARWFIRRRGMMTGILLSGIGTGVIVMPPTARWLISIYDWRFSYIIVGIVVLAVLIVAAQFLRRDPGQMGLLPYGGSEIEHPDLLVQTEGFSFREAIRTRQLWLVFAITFSFGCLIHTTSVHIVPHATDLGISPVVAASLLAVIGGVSIAGRIGFGSTADRIGTRLVFVVVFVLMLAAYLWLIRATEAWMLYLFAVIYGFAWGGGNASMPLMVAELFGLKSHGTLIGMAAFAGTMGGAVGPLLAGYIFDVTASYQLAFTVAAVVSAVALVLALSLKPIRKGGLMRSL